MKIRAIKHTPTLCGGPLRRLLAAAALCAALSAQFPAFGQRVGPQAEGGPGLKKFIKSLNLDRQMPEPPKTLKLNSGQIPQQCMFLLDSPMLVDCWLNNHDKVAAAIVWDFTGMSKPTPVAWAQWDPNAREALRTAYWHARQWKESGMLHFQGYLVQDPAENINLPEIQANAGVGWQVLDGPTAAWPLYLNHVGMSLAAEIHGWVPWSILAYDQGALNDLLTGYQNMFTTHLVKAQAKGYVLRHSVTPTNPTYTYMFLHRNNLIAETPRKTIARLLDWSRGHLSHWVGAGPGVDFDHWQYYGGAPFSRVVQGTVRLSDPDGTLRHYTRGCSGTTDFLAWALRVVNIPVKHERTPQQASGCAHAHPSFSGSKLYLSHGDDPYAGNSKGAFPAEYLLLTQQEWDEMFVKPSAEQACLNVGRRPAELSLVYLPEGTVETYCKDQLFGTNHVYEWNYANYFTVQQLQEVQLWERLAEKAKTADTPNCNEMRKVLGQ